MYKCVYIQIDYPDIQLMKPGGRSSQLGGGMNNLDKLLALDQDETRMGRGRYNSESSIDAQVRTSPV